MATTLPKTDVNIHIHIRARVRDRDLIDQAAELAGANRSQFILASSLKEAMNVLLDQTMIVTDQATFQKVLAWMDTEPMASERDGMQRLRDRKADWVRE